MYPDFLIADKYVTLYGIMIAVGIVFCILLLRFFGKRDKIDQKFLDFVELNGYVSIAIGFGVAYLYQVVYNAISSGHLDFHDGGLTFLGGLIGGVVTFLIIYNIMKKKYNTRIASILPIAPICITIAHAFGRIGCFFAGCCYGKIADPNDFFYFTAVKFKYLSGVRYPTNLFEAIFLFILCGVMAILLLKKHFKYTFLIYLPAYGIWRFFIEFLRDDDRGQIFPGVTWLTPSQFYALIMIIGTVPLYFFMRYLFKEDEKRVKNLATEETKKEEEKTENPEMNKES